MGSAAHSESWGESLHFIQPFRPVSFATLALLGVENDSLMSAGCDLP